MRQTKKQFLVLGLGRFGASVARSLTEMGHEVMAVDCDQDRVDEVAEYVDNCVQANATDEDVLRSFDPASFDACIVAVGTNVRDSVMMALLCKEAGSPMVVAKAMDDLHGKLLAKIGVDRVIFPERDMGQRLAKSLVSPSMLDMMDLAEGYQIAEVLSPAAWDEKTLEQLSVRRKYNVSVIAVRRNGRLIASPGADTRLEEGDALILLGREEDVDRIDRL